MSASKPILNSRAVPAERGAVHDGPGGEQGMYPKLVCVFVAELGEYRFPIKQWGKQGGNL